MSDITMSYIRHEETFVKRFFFRPPKARRARLARACLFTHRFHVYFPEALNNAYRLDGLHRASRPYFRATSFSS